MAKAKMYEQCRYAAGPYQGYHGQAEYDAKAGVFHGEVTGLRDVVTFQGRTPAELAQAFQESVDDYLEFCRARGEKPEQPFSGKFITRIPPELHQTLSRLAYAAHTSLNQFVADGLSRIAAAASIDSPAAEVVELPGSKNAKSRTSLRRSRVAKKSAAKRAGPRATQKASDRENRRRSRA